MDIYHNLRNLAQSNRAQNLFVAAKELHIRLFKNDGDYSRLQENYLSFLYMYDSIHRDIVIDKISPKVLDDEIYTDSYLLWKRKIGKKEDNTKKKEPTNRNLQLVSGNKINFPANEEK